MDIEIYLKVATVLVALLGGCVLMWRANKELFFGSRNSLREEYKFAKAFFDDLEKQPDMHPYARQKGFQAIAGDPLLPPKEIEYLLTLRDPASVLMDYVFAREFLEHLPTAGKHQITFKPQYSKASRRKTLRLKYATLFFASYLIAVSPILASSWGMISTPLSLRLLLFTLPFLGATYFAARAVLRIKRAELLVKNQQVFAVTGTHSITSSYRQPSASSSAQLHARPSH